MSAVATEVKTGSSEIWFGKRKNGDKVRLVFVNKKEKRWLQVLHNGQLMQLTGYVDENAAVEFL